MVYNPEIISNYALFGLENWFCFFLSFLAIPEQLPTSTYIMPQPSLLIYSQKQTPMHIFHFLLLILGHWNLPFITTISHFVIMGNTVVAPSLAENRI